MKLSSLTGIYKNSMHSKILGTGSYLPSSVRTNADLEQMVETSDEWIVERTGIRERRIAGADETVATLSYQAALRALEAAGLTAADLDMIVLATTSAENAFPAAACELQGLLGVPSIPAFDVAAACAGFTYALSIADQFRQIGRRPPCAGRRGRCTLPHVRSTRSRHHHPVW